MYIKCSVIYIMDTVKYLSFETMVWLQILHSLFEMYLELELNCILSFFTIVTSLDTTLEGIYHLKRNPT